MQFRLNSSDVLELLGDDAAHYPSVDALVVPASAPVALTPPPIELTPPKRAPDSLDSVGSGSAKKYGAGRHGSRIERVALGCHMRACKAQRNLRTCKDRMAACSEKLILYLPEASALSNCDLGSRRGNRVTVQTILDIGFSVRGRTEALSQKHGISKPWVMALRLYVVAMLLACQNLLLGSLIISASLQSPAFVLTRLAWDETGEKASTQL